MLTRPVLLATLKQCAEIYACRIEIGGTRKEKIYVRCVGSYRKFWISCCGNVC